VEQRHVCQSAPQVARIAAALVLDQQRRRMAAHVGMDLAGQRVRVAAVEVPHDGAGFVAASRTGAEHAMPELRVARAARRAMAQALIEQAYLVEHLAPEGHIGAGADLPDRRAAAAVLGEEGAAEVDAAIAAAKAPIGLEMRLRL